MDLSHPALFATVALFVAMPIAIWFSRRTGEVLHTHDAELDQIDFDRVAAAIPAFDDTDPLAQIASLIDEEVALIREILNDRASGGQVTAEHVVELRSIHRRGLALRQRCGDYALDDEVGWLQGFGSLALMADLSELDRASFEDELNFRATEVRQAVEMRRFQASSR